MRRILWIVMIAALLIAAAVAGGYAASKSYQFTGTVKAVDGGMLTVEKTAKETWQFEVPKDVKGTPNANPTVTPANTLVTAAVACSGDTRRTALASATAKKTG